MLGDEADRADLRWRLLESERGLCEARDCEADLRHRNAEQECLVSWPSRTRRAQR